MKFIVNTPSPSFNEERCGIKFTKGTSGEVELTEAIIKAFKEAGYEVTEVKEEVKEEKPKAKANKKRGE